MITIAQSFDIIAVMIIELLDQRSARQFSHNTHKNKAQSRFTILYFISKSWELLREIFVEDNLFV